MGLNIALFASGTGTNVDNIINFFSNNKNINIKLVVCNKADAIVLKKAAAKNVPVAIVSDKAVYNSEKLLHFLRANEIDWIVLAGFLWLIPSSIIKSYPNKIVNIHPSLLPKFGGKGMYGTRVHESVIANKEKESGITVHYVNERFDEGEIIFQKSCLLTDNESAASLAQKVHLLEYEHFPKVLEKLFLKQ